MSNLINSPKAFISYSWSDPSHEQWVIDLCKRLTGDGVSIILDKWELKEGHDLNHFMEKMVKDDQVSRVLVISDKKYKEKADHRAGGVGTESQIISKKVYEEVAQEKFIPIVCELNADGKPFLPIFMEGRVYLDFSNNEAYEENYKKLLRNLFGKPEYQKPPLGVPPAFLLEDQPAATKTSYAVTKYKKRVEAIGKPPSAHTIDFFESFRSELEGHRITGLTGEDFDQVIYDSIGKMEKLRDDFMDWFSTAIDSDGDFDIHSVKDFFESLIPFMVPPPRITSYHKLQFDNYLFFLYELFLYAVSILLKRGKYSEASVLIYGPYFFKEYTNSKTVVNHCKIFNRHVQSLDEVRNNRLKSQRVTITADLIKERANGKHVSFSEIVGTDIILFHLTKLNEELYKSENPIYYRSIWFPRTSVFFSYGIEITVFDKTLSKRYFQKVAPLFKVESPEQLKELVQKASARDQEKPINISFNYEIPALSSLIDLQRLAVYE